jgi:hypothetical protein
VSIKTWFTGKNKADLERPEAPAPEASEPAPKAASAGSAASVAPPASAPPVDFVAILEGAGLHVSCIFSLRDPYP